MKHMHKKATNLDKNIAWFFFEDNFFSYDSAHSKKKNSLIFFIQKNVSQHFFFPRGFCHLRPFSRRGGGFVRGGFNPRVQIRTCGLYCFRITCLNKGLSKTEEISSHHMNISEIYCILAWFNYSQVRISFKVLAEFYIESPNTIIILSII